MDIKAFFSNQLRKIQGKDQDRLIESEYTLEQDLKIPSLSVIKEVYKKNISPEEQAISYVDNLIRNKRDKLLSYYTDKKIIDEYLEKFRDVKIKEYLKEYDESSDITFYDQSWTVGANERVKNRIIEDLRNRGYNAVSDMASVGVSSIENIGIDPLLTFDSKSLKHVKSRKVSSKESKESEKSFMKWWKKANKQ